MGLPAGFEDVAHEAVGVVDCPVTALAPDTHNARQFRRFDGRFFQTCGEEIAGILLQPLIDFEGSGDACRASRR